MGMFLSYVGEFKKLYIIFPCSINICNYTEHKHINEKRTSSVAEKR
jgi:hypothetical protein